MSGNTAQESKVNTEDVQVETPATPAAEENNEE